MGFVPVFRLFAILTDVLEQRAYFQEVTLHLSPVLEQRLFAALQNTVLVRHIAKSLVLCCLIVGIIFLANMTTKPHFVEYCLSGSSKGSCFKLLNAVWTGLVFRKPAVDAVATKHLLTLLAILLVPNDA